MVVPGKWSELMGSAMHLRTPLLLALIAEHLLDLFS